MQKMGSVSVGEGREVGGGGPNVAVIANMLMCRLPCSPWTP